MWRLTEIEIYDWLKEKQLEFVVKESIKPNSKVKYWLHDHIFADMDEIIFCEFLIILSEWLLRLVRNNETWMIHGPREWTAS